MQALPPVYDPLQAGITQKPGQPPNSFIRQKHDLSSWLTIEIETGHDWKISPCDF